MLNTSDRLTEPCKPQAARKTQKGRSCVCIPPCCRTKLQTEILVLPGYLESERLRSLIDESSLAVNNKETSNLGSSSPLLDFSVLCNAASKRYASLTTRAWESKVVLAPKRVLSSVYPLA